MPRSARLRESDLRAVFRLIGECRELGDDPRLWREHLLGWVARTGGAAVANEYEAELGAETAFGGITGWGWENSGLDMRYWVALNAEFERRGAEYSPMIRPYMAAVERGAGPCLSRPDLVADPDWYETDYYRHYHRPSGADVMMYCMHPQPNGRVTAVVLVRPAEDPDFTPRAKTVVGAAHALVAPLVGGPLAGYSEPSPAALPPRARDVLVCLLEGDSDKQIAARLGIGPLTVNQHVKRVFRHFGVRSRPELLARWVKRGWGGRFAWAENDI